ARAAETRGAGGEAARWQAEAEPARPRSRSAESVSRPTATSAGESAERPLGNLPPLGPTQSGRWRGGAYHGASACGGGDSWGPAMVAGWRGAFTPDGTDRQTNFTAGAPGALKTEEGFRPIAKHGAAPVVRAHCARRMR